MLKIYHVAGTRSVRTLWLAGELDLEHEVVSMPFDPAVMHGPAYLAVNPTGKVPAIDDDGFVLTESGAITQYLLARYGGGRLEPQPRPEPGSAEHGRFLQWLYFPEATIMPHLGLLLRQARAPRDGRHQPTIDHATAKATELLAYTDTALRAADYILGPRFTAADIMLGYTVGIAGQLGLLAAGTPQLNDYSLACGPARPCGQPSPRDPFVILEAVSDSPANASWADGVLQESPTRQRRSLASPWGKRL